MNAQDYLESDPMYQVATIHRMLQELITHCRRESVKIDEPKAQVLFETSAEVLGGLKTAYEHYATGEEPAMRR